MRLVMTTQCDAVCLARRTGYSPSMRVIILALLLIAQSAPAIMARPEAWMGPLQLCAAVSTAGPSVDRYTGEHTLTMKLTPLGTRQVAALTRHMVGQRLPIRVGGRVISRPYVMDPILSGHLEINGGTEVDRARLIVATRAPCRR